ncbi:MAG: hypothetical protein LBU30_03770 [Candidatus Methanoplasma sp.]|nr:hypothetical protein [Candidatus Methanoplasma sp.]
MIYDVIVKTEPEESEYTRLSYEDMLRVMIDGLLSENRVPMTIRRRCCGSVHEQTMSVEIRDSIRRVAGVNDGFRIDEKSTADMRSRLDAAINNWYIRGEISISDDKLIRSSDTLPADP